MFDLFVCDCCCLCCFVSVCVVLLHCVCLVFSDLLFGLLCVLCEMYIFMCLSFVWVVCACMRMFCLCIYICVCCV